MEAPVMETIGTLVGMILTLLVFSYLLGDNALYRLAEHLFVGIAVGYAVVIAFHSVLAPKVLAPLVVAVDEANWEQTTLLLIALGFGLLLWLKPIKSLSWLGNMSVGLMLGVGAALAIGGALMGTLWPQIDATANLSTTANLYGPGWGLFSAIVVLVGTLAALFHFHRGAGGKGKLAGLSNLFVRFWGGLGRWFVLIAFAAILAATFVTRLSLLTGRIQFLLDGVRELLGV
jgi:hypothetical protein